MELLITIAIIGFSFIALMLLLIRGKTDHEPSDGNQETDKFLRYHIDTLNPDYFNEISNYLPERESKETPHYDTLVDAEWAEVRANRLEDNFYEENDKAVPLGDLLEEKKKY